MTQNFTKEKIKTISTNNSTDDTMTLEDKLFNYIESSDVVNIKKILSIDNIKFWEFLDNENSTVLIKLAYADLEIVFDYIQIFIENLNKKQLKIYVNKKSQNGFTALHYASFRGNVNLCEKLIQNHADINLINNNGLNVIHMASQGDQPATLILFKEKYKMDPQMNDNILSSPLHWAAYMGSDFSLDFLASWDHFIDKKDKDGFTPLHLAVMTGI